MIMRQPRAVRHKVTSGDVIVIDFPHGPIQFEVEEVVNARVHLRTLGNNTRSSIDTEYLSYILGQSGVTRVRAQA
jgi:hypothetical protein